jgi:WS/DGAT/MGAT family acyltransferase
VERATRAWRDLLRSGFELSSQSLNWALDPQQQVRDLQTVNRALAVASPALLRPAPATPFNRPVTGQRSYEHLAMSFGEIRGVRGALGGTINDVVLTTLSGGLGAYLRSRGQRTDGLELRAMVPVNVRAEADQSALGNQVSMLIATLPVGIVDAAERHKAVVGGMNRLKEANQAGGFALLTRLSDLVPPAVQAMAGMLVPNGQSLFNIVCTNVPGPQIPLYIAGRKMEEHWPLVPVSMGLGMNVALTSYNGALYWGICADPNLVPDLPVVAGAIERSFEELKTAAMAAADTAA